MAERVSETEIHGTVTGGKDKPVPIEPMRVGRAVMQMLSPQRIGHWCGPHRQPGMSAVCLLNGIN